MVFLLWLVSIVCEVLGILTALVAVAYTYFIWTYQYWKRKGVPYKEPRIPYGSTGNPFVTPMGESVADIYKEARQKGRKYCGVYVFLTPFMLVVDIDLVKHVLTKDFQYFMDRGVYLNEKDDPIGSHIFALSGSRWKNVRAKLTSAFTSGKLKAMFQTLVDCGLVLEEFIEDNFKLDEPIDIKNVLSCFSTDVIGSCAFGLDCNSFKEPNSVFRHYGNKIFTITKTRALQAVFTENFPALSRFLKLRQVPKDISDFFMKLVKDTISYREKNNVRRKDILQLLIDIRKNEGEETGKNSADSDGNTLTLEEIVAQSFIFFAAGFETSSTTTTFALFELAIHPEIQDRLRQEIQTVLANHNDKITYDSLNEMKYMGQIIDETLRMHSPARILQRLCIKDYKIPGENFVIEKGTKLLVSVKGAHYDENYWEKPNEFNPDRFSEEKRKEMNQYSHLPFGNGPRVCIAERFGLMQVKVGLTCLLRKFKVKLNERTKLPLKMSTTAVVSSAEGGIWLNLEKYDVNKT